MSKCINKILMLEATIGAAILCTIVFSIQSNFGFGWADEGLLWYGSQRTYAGELAIRDFFSYDPGRYYWNSIIFSILGDTGLHSVLFAAATFGAVGLTISWYTMGVAKIGIAWRVFFAVLISIALAYPRHKVYEQSLSLILVALVYSVLLSPTSTKRWFVYGLLTGVAAIFGRNHGVFFVVAAMLSGIYVIKNKKLNELPRVCLFYALGVVFGYLPLIMVFVADLGFRSSFIDSVLSVADWQLPLPIPFFWKVNYSRGFNFDTLHALAIGLFCILVPITYIVGASLLYGLSNQSPEKKTTYLLYGASSLAGIPYLHQAFDRADFGHIAQSTLPVLVAYAAIVPLACDLKRIRTLVLGFCFVALIVILAAWLPSLPSFRMLRAEVLLPGSTVSHEIGNRHFTIDTPQSIVLNEVRNIVERCHIGDGEFLALPHYPGVYAYLGIKAPFWEMYYLYKRSASFQRRHIDAISNVRLILIAPDATVDGLESLKLKNTYGQLLAYIENKYSKIDSIVLPYGMSLYVDAESCGVY